MVPRRMMMIMQKILAMVRNNDYESNIIFDSDTNNNDIEDNVNSNDNNYMTGTS